ncbi:MAG: hypothetical protein C4287_16265 [Leptolyngbya sp. ERB_1_2]
MLDHETMQHEFESEYDYEYEGEFEANGEGEYEGEQFLGGVLSGIAGALDLESEYEDEYEGENEDFIKIPKKWKKGFRGLSRSFIPILRQAIPIAAQAVGTAISGNPQVGQNLGAMASQLSQEGEFEYELNHEFESESEYESESQPLVEDEASEDEAESEAEAEAFAGALFSQLVPITNSAPMRRIYPGLVKGAAAYTRTMRKSPQTRPFVPMMPLIFRRTNQSLRSLASQGRPITPNNAAKVMTTHIAQVLGNPQLCARAIARYQRSTQRKRPKRTFANY